MPDAAASDPALPEGGCQLVDGALGALGTPANQMPVRIFIPQVLAHTGAKLSKSLLRGQGKGPLPEREALGVVAIGIELIDPPR